MSRHDRSGAGGLSHDRAVNRRHRPDQESDRLVASLIRSRARSTTASGGPTTEAQAAPAGDGKDELADATRAELYEKAKEADIPGRSSMNKDDLIEALHDQR